MGNACIWYQPDGATVQVKIDLGRKLREREGPHVQYSGAYSQALGGASTTVIHAGRMNTSIGLTWQRTGTDGTDAGSVLRRKLFGLQAHLKRGGCCTFVEDTTYAWAAFLGRLPGDREAVLPYTSPVITGILAPGVSPVGREVYIHSDADSYLTEMQLCSDISVIHLTMAGALKETYKECRWVLVREAGTYPAMRVPEGLRTQNFLTHRDDRVFFLDLPLEEDCDRLEDLARFGSQLPDEAESPGGHTVPEFDLGPPDTGPERWRW